MSRLPLPGRLPLAAALLATTALACALGPLLEMALFGMDGPHALRTAALGLLPALALAGVLARSWARSLRFLRARLRRLAARHGAAVAEPARGGEFAALREEFDHTAQALDRERLRLELAHREAADRGRELERHASEARELALVASRTHNAVIITDAHGLILWVNPGFTRITGYGLDEVRGRKPGDLLQGPGTDPATVAQMRARLAAGLGFQGEILNYARDGREYWLDIDIQPVKDRDGRIEKFMAVELDITDRKLKEQALRQAEEFLDSVIENMPSMVFVKDARGLRYQRINRAAEEIIGLPRTAFIGRSDRDFFDAGKAARYTAQDRACLAARSTLSIEEDEFVTAAGETRVLRTRKVPIRDKNGAPRYLLGISEDITDERVQQAALRQAKEQAEAASRAKSQFLANMSHEIRTPMNGVLGMTELLLGTGLSDRQRRFAETAYRSGEALLSIINDILDFSKIEAGRMELQAGEFALPQLVEEIAGLLAPRAQAKGIELACVIDAALPPGVMGDAGRIRQVLLNLAGNAIKFTERGEVVLKAQLAAPAAAGAPCRVRFTVRDTGIGMAPELRERLFRVFEQGSSDATRRYGGTGLGLAISQHLVRLMGGEIAVASTEGSGSSFEFTLALAAGGNAPAPDHGHDTVALAGRRLLIVEDNPTNRDILAQQLEGWRTDCTAVESGAAALEVLQAAQDAEFPFEAALIDMHMPGMSGLELAARIKASPRLAGTRLAMLTSVADAREPASARAAGIDIHLEKPVRQAELKQALRRLLAPRAPALPAPAPRAAPAVVPSVPAASSRGRVLVVEDNEVNREIACTMLEQAGCDHAVAENGREALGALAAQSFDLVLMDCQMPEMDGFEAVRRVRAGQPDAPLMVPASVPIVALTANALAGDRERCLKAGFDDYLSKPFSEPDLRRILTRWLPATAKALDPPRPVPAAAPETPPQAPSEESPLDGKIFGSLQALEKNGAAGLIARLSGAFLASAPPLFERLREATARGDMDAACQAAHTLKSSNANVGALAVSRLFAQIETDARRSQHAAAAARLEVAEREFARVVNALRRLAPA